MKLSGNSLLNIQICMFTSGYCISIFTVVNKGSIFWEKEAKECCPGLAAMVLI